MSDHAAQRAESRHTETTPGGPMFAIETYDGFTREGTSTCVKALRIGGERWRVELMKGGVYIRLGNVAFSAGFEWADA